MVEKACFKRAVLIFKFKLNKVNGFFIDLGIIHPCIFSLEKVKNSFRFLVFSIEVDDYLSYNI